MARPRAQPPPEPTPKPESAAPEVSAILGVGAAGAVAGEAPAAAAGAGVVVTGAAVRAATARIIASFNRFGRKRQAEYIEILPTRLQREFPEHTPEEIAKLVREEARRESVFRRKQRERLQRDLPDALQQADPAKRVERTQMILDREQRYLKQREEALAERAYTAMEMLHLQRESPQGAFWRLSDGVQQHTPGCIAMGNKFWPWSVLRIIHPQLHPGCACHLYSLDQAVERGYMTASQVPDPADAKRRADKILKLIKEVYETATQEEIDAYLLELAEVEWDERLAPAKATGRWRLKPLERGGEWEALIEAALGVEVETLDISKVEAHVDADPHPECEGSPQTDFAVHRVLPAVLRGRWPKLAARLEATSPRWGKRAVTEATTEFEEWTLEEAVGGSIARRAVYGAKPGERFGRGTSKGGQFKPRRGARPGKPTIRGLARTALRRAIPDLPKVPRQAATDKDGEYVWIRGRYTFIPEHREFKRRIDGIDWHSPAGSGNLYRNGYLVHVPGEKLPHHNDLDRPVAADIRNVPSTAPWHEEVGKERADKIEADLQASYNSARQASDDQIKDALAKQSRAWKPVGPGELTTVVLDALQANDFTVAEVRSIERPDVERGAAALAVLRHTSGAEVAITSDGGKVLGVVWNPVTRVDEVPALGDTPPESWGDFVTDLTAIAHEVAAEVGRTAQVSDIRVGTAAEDYANHTGSWLWGGKIVLGEEVPDGIEMIARARAEGRPLTEHEAGEVWLSYATGIHEALHAAHGISAYDYQQPALMGMEEALNEEHSRIVTAKVLKRLGLTEALQFQRDRPDSIRGRGAYLYYRSALDDILNQAKVAPEEREEFIRHLRFDVPPSQRSALIGERIARVAPEETDGPEQAARWVDGVIEHAGQVKSPLGFEPILHVPLKDVPHSEPYLIDGRPIKPNMGVEVMVDGHRFSGRVASIYPLDAEGESAAGAPFLFSMVTDQFEHIDNILPREVSDLDSVEESVILPDGTGVKEGDLIRYDNRADGGMSTAVVEQVTQSSQRGPMPGLLKDAWVLHARTTQDSLAPDQEIVLTLARTGGRVERVDAEGPEVPEAAPEAPGAGFVSRLPELERLLAEERVRVAAPLSSFERRSELANEIKAERARMDADTEALRKGDSVLIKGYAPDEPDRAGTVVKTNKASIDVELLNSVGNPVVWRFEKSSRNPDGTWYAAIGRSVKKGPTRSEGIVDRLSIPRGLFEELWMLEYDTAPGEGTDHDDLADELARVRDATPRTARNLTVELTPRRARYLDQALDYHDTIWEEATQSYDAGDRARANSYRRTARRLRERLAGVKTEGITDPAAELRSMQEGTHPRVFFGLEDRATTGGRGEEAGSQPAWTDADKLQVGRQISDALEDYAQLIEKPEFHRVLRWSGDESYARTLQNGWHEPTRPRKANIYLRLDDEERFDGWGVTDTGSSTARVDIRRPGVNYIDNPRENVLGVAADDARYTAIHEAHHMYGSGSEFDFGSEVAHAWHGLQRGLADEQMLTSRRAVTNRIAVNPNSRLSRSLRALFGDDLLDEWGQEAGWDDLFARRRVPPEDNSIEGRVATLNEYRDEYGYSVLQQIDYLERKNLVDVSGLTSYGSRIEPGERAYMRPNGETLVLGVDGQARVLESMSAVRPVETRGVDVTQRRVLPLGRVDDQPPEVDMADELAGLAGPIGPRKWTRIEDGYESDNARIWDNGAGLGPAAGGGRWAVEIEGRWIANVDTLAQAKERVETELAKPPVVRSEGIEPPTPIHVQAWNLRQELDGATWRRNNLEDSDPQRAEADAEVERLSNEVAAAEAQTGGRVLRLNDEQMHRGEIKMRDLAKRAKKLGLDEPRLRVMAEEMVPVPWPGLTSRWSREEWEKRGDVTPITYVVAEGPEPKLNGWEFVATLQHLEGINVIRRVPGTEEDVDLSQHRAGEATCDYCKTVRDRKDTFIVHQVDTDAAHAELADDKGNVQVGRNCLRDFLGHGNPQEIASYLERWMNLDELEEEGEGPSGGRAKEYMPVEDYLMHVATMLRTSGWASRSSGELATADQARMNRQAYNSQERDKSGRQMWVDPIPQDEGRAKAAIAWAREYLGAKVHQSQDASEFESNMYAMAKGEHVPDRGEGILAYVMVAHAKFEEREIERRERAKVEADSVHVGTVGERMDVEATVMSVYEHEGNYGTTFITKLRDDQGNIYKWFGSYELERGSVVRAKWTVKDHSEYKGVKETVLNRPSKLETVRTEGGEEGLPEGWVPTPVSEVRAGDNLLVLPTDRRGTAHRLATPDENALDGVGTEVVEREARLVAWTFTGEELELPAEGEVVRRVPEVRTEGVGGVPSASSISRVLAQAGYRALGSGTPRSREGTRVSGGRDHVSVWVDFDNEAAAARRSEELEQVLAEKGYATRRAAPAGFWVTGRVEGARTEGVEPPGDPTRLVSKGADPQWGTPVYETGDGRGRIVLDPTYETWCDDPHPMKFTREERDAWKALSSFEREQRRRNMPYEKYRALDYGKKGYLCPGGEEHHYSQWVPEIEGERLEDVHDTFGKAKAALEAALGHKLTLQRQRKPKPEPVVLSPEDEEFKASLDDELAALDDSLASFRERLKGPDADFVDTEQLGRLERRREQVLALLDGLGAGAARTEGIVSPTGPFFHGTNVPLQPGDRLTARPEDRAPNYAAPGVEGWAYMSTGDHMAERFAVSVAGGRAASRTCTRSGRWARACLTRSRRLAGRRISGWPARWRSSASYRCRAWSPGTPRRRAWRARRAQRASGRTCSTRSGRRSG